MDFEIMNSGKLTLLFGFVLACLISPISGIAAEKGKFAGNAEQVSAQAVDAYQAGNFSLAATYFKRVVQLAPANVKAWLFLGESLAKSGDNMGARRAFAKVMALQSSGPVAERAGEQLAKLPEPDLFTLQLDSGITLGDWLPVAQQQAAQGKRDVVLGEIGQYLNKFGPVPQLLVMQEKLNKEVQAEQEKQMQGAIAAIKVKDADTAKAALAQIRDLKRQAPGNLKVIALEAKACHLMQDWRCAEAAYGAWLKAAPRNDIKRKSIVAAMLKSKQHEALPVSGLAALVEEYKQRANWQVIEASEAYQNWPVSRVSQIQVKRSCVDNEPMTIKSTRQDISVETEDKFADIAQEGESNTKWIGTRKYTTEETIASIEKPRDLASHSLKMPFIFNERVIQSISGSLFPLKSGSEMTLMYENKMAGATDSRKVVYKAVEVLPAAQLYSSLPGNAWKVKKTEAHEYRSSAVNGKDGSETVDYWIEELGIFASVIGEELLKKSDMGLFTTMKFYKEIVIPVQGRTYTRLTADYKFTCDKYEVTWN